MAKYLYRGPVMEFDRCIVNNWTGQTEAPSEAKAKSNLSYQFKKSLFYQRVISFIVIHHVFTFLFIFYYSIG